MKNRNVTLSLPDGLVRRLKVIAAQQETSISAMLTEMLRRLADDDGYEAACRGMLGDLKKGYNLGTNGNIRWTRDSLHER